MANYNQYPGLPGVKYEAFDADALLAAAARGEWFEQSFIDTQPFTKERLLAVLRADAKRLADFADTAKMFFVGVVKVDPQSESSQWTIMPGQKDPQIAEAARELYAEELKGAAAHFIIGPSGDYFTNSEDIGVMDKDTGDCKYAVDVTREDGIAIDRVIASPGKIIFSPDVWVEWNGQSAISPYTGFEADPRTEVIQEIMIRDDLLKSMRAALGK